MQKKRVLVSGCNGTMGRLVCSAINNSNSMVVASGFDKSGICPAGFDFPVYSDFTKIRFSKMFDVMIDFSSPEGTKEILKYAFDFNIPIVIATTGLDKSVENLIKNFADMIPIFCSANMSFDVALLRNILKSVSVQLADTDIEISETHHNRKADAPSGTAKLLANTVNEALGNTKTLVYGREGKREKNEIGLSSIRGGNIAGEHTIQFFGEYETLEIKHTTYSREVFAEGAVKAARFLLTKRPGLYSMDDLVQSI